MSTAQEILRASEADFYPSDEVAEQLSRVKLAAFIGPVAVGKTTTMDRIARLDARFGMVRDFTTRARRPGETDQEFQFLDPASGVLDELASMVQNRSGNLVQYVVHPTTGHVYGTFIEDYNRPYMMLPVLSHSVEGLRKLPFAKMVEVGMVTEPTEWLRRFDGRQMDQAESQKRAAEGVQSLEWLLAQDEVLWVATPSGIHPETAADIRDIIVGHKLPDPTIRELGHQLLETIASYS